MKYWMTREEFIKYAHEATDFDALEGLYDTITQHNSEVNGFGDSWPGAMIQIRSSIAEVKSIERQLARLEGRPEREFRFNVCSPR